MKLQIMLLYLFENNLEFTLVGIGCHGKTICTWTVHFKLFIFIIAWKCDQWFTKDIAKKYTGVVFSFKICCYLIRIQ